jgi:hypothetical protein
MIKNLKVLEIVKSRTISLKFCIEPGFQVPGLNPGATGNSGIPRLTQLHRTQL